MRRLEGKPPYRKCFLPCYTTALLIKFDKDFKKPVQYRDAAQVFILQEIMHFNASAKGLLPEVFLF